MADEKNYYVEVEFHGSEWHWVTASSEEEALQSAVESSETSSSLCTEATFFPRIESQEDIVEDEQ